MLKEKWMSLLFHIQNKHCWTGYTIYHKCDHPQLSPEERATKAWLSPKSDAFVALQKIVLNTRLLKDLEHLTKFSHTGILEVYHSVMNKWVPKSTHFSFDGMVSRCKLAAIDFNSGQHLQQAKTKKEKAKREDMWGVVRGLVSDWPLVQAGRRIFRNMFVSKETAATGRIR